MFMEKHPCVLHQSLNTNILLAFLFWSYQIAMLIIYIVFILADIGFVIEACSSKKDWSCKIAVTRITVLNGDKWILHLNGINQFSL